MKIPYLPRPTFSLKTSELARLIVLASLAGCAAPAVSPGPPAPPVVVIMPPPKPAPALPKPVARVTAQFERVARKELVAVTRPHVTVETVLQVHAADTEARQAMDKLARQRPRFSPATLASAQAAVHKLDGILTAILDKTN